MVVGVIAVLFGTAYSASFLVNYHGIDVDYVGFMKQSAATAVLPVCLILICVCRVRFSYFELVRVDPRKELLLNMSHVAVAGCLCALYGALVFSVMEFAVHGERVTARNLSLTLMLLVQCVMMNVIVGLVQLLIANIGVPIEPLTVVLVGFFMVVRWLLMPLSGDVDSVVFYFWYPMSPLWNVVALRQIIPCVGCCLLLVLTNHVIVLRKDKWRDA